MPGVLKQTGDTSDLRSDGFAHGANASIMAEGNLKKEIPSSLVNGIDTIAKRTYANGYGSDTQMSPDQVVAKVKKLSTLLPPEIEHITYGYLSLSTWVTRQAQDTFSSLGEVINDMVDMQASQSSAAVSYVNGAGTSQSSQVSLQKKTRLWNFANDRRAQFIKIMVLSKWCRQSEDVSKVIDLNVWMERNKRLYDDATAWIGELVRLLAPAKMPSPDLRTALEVLSTGRASWLPDLGYLPPQPLSPQQQLKGLRKINTLLIIRLNLHETIPPSFRNYSIASGRATFKVDNDFEVDLSIADENPASQLYFIDFRFLFSPCPTELPSGRLRDEIERKTNDSLRREGLNGCFDFLHDLVLTHKLSILRKQALELTHGRWSENLRVEVLHRSLVIQYWLNRPGGKNWIEVGVKSGKRVEKSTSVKGAGIPYISLRWYRHGKEVVDFDIKPDLGNLSIEVLLRRIIAAHTNHILKETKRKLLEGLIYSKKLLSIKRKVSRTEPADCTLCVQVTGTTTATITQEPISGWFAILPPSNLHIRVERELNSLKDPAIESSSRIAALRCLAVLDQVESKARLVGWEPVKTLNPSPETVKRLFTVDTMRLAFFRIKTWDNHWMITSTTGMRGDTWWVTQLYDETSTTTFTNRRSIYGDNFVAAFKISISKSIVMEPSCLNLSHVENVAAAMISQFIDTRYLTSYKIPYRQQQPNKSQSSNLIPDLFVRFSEAYIPSISKTLTSNKNWCHEIIKLTFVGLSRSRKSVIHVASARLVTPIVAIRTLTSSLDSSVSFHPTNGTFAFRLLTSIHESTIPSLLERLGRIERLVRFLTIIERHQLQCETISLDRLIFTYGSSLNFQPLKAEVTFASGSPISLTFEEGNPQLYIREQLTTLLNAASGFEHVLLLLRLTLPILRAFTVVTSSENEDMLDCNAYVLIRSATCYLIRYESPKAMFEFRLRQRQDKAFWFSRLVQDRQAISKGVEDNAVVEAWKGLCQEMGQNWKGMKDSIVAETEDVQALISKINEVMKNLAIGTKSDQGETAEEDESVKIEGESEVVVLD